MQLGIAGRARVVACALIVTASLGTVSSAAAAGPSPQLRIGLVANTDGLFDRSFNEQSADAVRAASIRLHALIDIRASLTPAAYEQSLASMAAQGYDLVIAVGPAEEQALGLVARAYPEVRFAIVGDSYRAPAIGALTNVVGLVFQDQESGYVAGYLAGLIARAAPATPTGNAVSTISGSLDRSANRYIAGFRTGARAADPQVRLLAGFSNAVITPGRCATLARSQIAAGSAVVFPVAGTCSAGAIAAAGAAHVWAIGSEVDQSPLGPTVLASAVDRADRAVALLIDSVAADTLQTGRDVQLGLAQGAVGLQGLAPGLSPTIVRRVRAVSNKVRAGRISIPTAPAPAG
jgi:basic membrane protein A